MSVHRIKLPHRLVQLGDVFHVGMARYVTVAIDRGGRNAYVLLVEKGDEWNSPTSYPLETLGELHGLKGDDLVEAKAAAE